MVNAMPLGSVQMKFQFHSNPGNALRHRDIPKRYILRLRTTAHPLHTIMLMAIMVLTLFYIVFFCICYYNIYIFP